MIDRKELRLTLDQIDNMRHAVGFEPENIRKGQRHCTLWRNYYCSLEGSASWEELLQNGLAERRVDVENQHVVYRVTSLGIKVLEYIFRISMEVK